MKNILVVGSCNMDLVIHTSRLPALGETIRGNGFETVPGGKGLNQAVATAKLGGSVAMIACVGEDTFGEELRETLSEAGVDISGVTTNGPGSGIAVITVCGGDNHIILDAGANARLTPQMLEAYRPLFERADWVVLQLEIPRDTALCAAKLAKECGASVLLNPAPFADWAETLFPYTDLLMPNRVEAEQLLRHPIALPDTADAVRELLARGIPAVIITLGGEGCVYHTRNAIYRQPACTVPVVDTTGAGDAFVGGFCAAVCGGDYDIMAAVAYATAVSAMVVGRRGASTSLPRKMDVERFGGRSMKRRRFFFPLSDK